jgi:hypothetical protein
MGLKPSVALAPLLERLGYYSTKDENVLSITLPGVTTGCGGERADTSESSVGEDASSEGVAVLDAPCAPARPAEIEDAGAVPSSRPSLRIDIPVRAQSEEIAVVEIPSPAEPAGPRRLHARRYNSFQLRCKGCGRKFSTKNSKNIVSAPPVLSHGARSAASARCQAARALKFPECVCARRSATFSASSPRTSAPRCSGWRSLSRRSTWSGNSGRR